MVSSPCLPRMVAQRVRSRAVSEPEVKTGVDGGIQEAAYQSGVLDPRSLRAVCDTPAKGNMTLDLAHLADETL